MKLGTGIQHGGRPDDPASGRKKRKAFSQPSLTIGSFNDQYQPLASAPQRRLAVLAQPTIELDLEVALAGVEPRSAPYAFVRFGMFGSLVFG